ncbi:hypothetical protein GJR96_03060 [Haloferax sp. MBLA0076]|uniref:Uncharacterized protein n=1 Tax=Haloferax litoreum TaxID=2666140 RepID=A0A6A8GCR1_9EURY|nr:MULTISPECIES: hypothetical protein [Haloferax]KAB1192469.1 hypothetical protein Hfx1148_03055 [Haloferax sp. CBA1148]MRX20938.1 hypothetical protein [Haloferax litoreum]
MTDDEHADDTPKSSDSVMLVLATGDRGSVFVGAILVGISVFNAARTLAIRSSGAFPNNDALGALFTLLVFAVGVVFLVQGAAGLFAAGRAATR